MKHSSIKSYLSILSLALCLAGTSAFAQGTGSKPTTLPAGSKLAAAWWQWMFSLPVTASPQFDTADCSAGQSGPVWFLASTFTGGTITRSCTIPAGKTLVFPVANAWADNTGCPDTDWNVHQLQGFASGFMDQVTSLSCTIDGVSVPNLSNHAPYRVTSVFSYDLPNDPNNVLAFFGLTCYASGATVFPATSDGVFVSVPPLPTGNHTIHISAAFSAAAGGLSLDITYNLTVQ
jgi:hypothetical protein